MLSVPEVALVAGSGIVGDRYYGAKQKYPGQNLTLIEAEEIEAFNARNGTSIELTGPRRNVVTRNVRLNLLVGREFYIGAVALRGILPVWRRPSSFASSRTELDFESTC